MPTLRSVLLSSAAVVTTGLLSYAVYFDYRRRTSPAFRKQLRQDKRRHQQSVQAAAREQEREMIALLTKALALVKDVQYPQSVDERERFFMEQLQRGEVLARGGAETVVEAAAAIFQSVKVYPNQVDLLMVLQKSLPQDLMSLVYAMLSAEVQFEEMAKQASSSLEQQD